MRARTAFAIAVLGLTGLGTTLAADDAPLPNASSTRIRQSTGRSRRSMPAPATWGSPACCRAAR